MSYVSFAPVTPQVGLHNDEHEAVLDLLTKGSGAALPLNDAPDIFQRQGTPLQVELEVKLPPQLNVDKEKKAMKEGAKLEYCPGKEAEEYNMAADLVAHARWGLIAAVQGHKGVGGRSQPRHVRCLRAKARRWLPPIVAVCLHPPA